jgi:cytochrome b involved in lipid metabolism
MGRGSNFIEDDSNNNKQAKAVTYFSWKEIKDSKKWIVIDDKVYNIENFAKKHPGGGDIITNHISQDVTVYDSFLLLTLNHYNFLPSFCLKLGCFSCFS